MHINSSLYALLFLAGMAIAGAAHGQQVSDTSYRFNVANPAYPRGQGPVVLFDQAHHNPFTLKGRFAAFYNVLSDDGYAVRGAREAVTPQLLADADIYVTVNALYDAANWNLPAHSIFSTGEIEALYAWVTAGGSLFLITDHMPCGAATGELARAFGFNIINGFTIRKDGNAEIFSKEKGNLHEHPITSTSGISIDSIRCWGGTGFIAPGNAAILTSLGDAYDVYLPSKVADITHPIAATIPKLSGVGLVNGAVLKIGKGRICVFADGAPFTAQLEGIHSNKRGMNHPDATQHAQFLLNILHWLAGEFD